MDFTVRRPRELQERYGAVLAYLARVELEVERNVLELDTVLPNAPDVDRIFYRDVWAPQEERHGVILDAVTVQIGERSAMPDLGSVSTKLKVLGVLGHLDTIQDLTPMLYYLTGMTTERSAVVAYNHLYDGLIALDETAVAETAIAPIRRQEPGHYAFYQLSARRLWSELSGWQRYLVRWLRSQSFAPVGANDERQKAAFGLVLNRLDIDQDLDGFAAQVIRAERELLWAHRQGLKVPSYVTRALREAVELAALDAPATLKSGHRGAFVARSAPRRHEQAPGRSTCWRSGRQKLWQVSSSSYEPTRSSCERSMAHRGEGHACNASGDATIPGRSSSGRFSTRSPS
ncbi:GTP-binding protein LepA [Nocardioides sp. YIM 152315]|nr:GTP-binding protein LepA [Nocardioides sp. YIM 152315]